MFDKEAEEYATRECCTTCNNINHFCKEKCECWTFAKKGAEFGYNKGKNEAKEIVKRLMHELVVSNRPYNEVELLVRDVEQFLGN